MITHSVNYDLFGSIREWNQIICMIQDSYPAWHSLVTVGMASHHLIANPNFERFIKFMNAFSVNHIKQP